MSNKRILIWYRNDLRIHDHEPLYQAIKQGALIIPFYCFDIRQFKTTSFGFPKTGNFRGQFLLESVTDLKKSLQDLGSNLIIRQGYPEKIIPELIKQLEIDAVYFHEEVTSEETDIENTVEKALKPLNVTFKGFWGATLYHWDDLPFEVSKLPEVFTSFRKKVEKNSTVNPILISPRKLRSLPDIEVRKIIKEEKDQIAAVILEPLVQGAVGMKICRKEFLSEIVRMFKESGIIVIFDEVMTGFGRTGKMFASDFIKEQPDIMCLAKSLTGGFIPLAATVFSEQIHREFVAMDFKKTFLHGHTFSANPVACSAALTSLKLFDEDKTFKKIKLINKIHLEFLNELSRNSNVSKVRILGTIAAFDYQKVSNVYGSSESLLLRQKFLENGLLLRPIGNTIYLMPPYCIQEKILKQSYEKLIEILQ